MSLPTGACDCHVHVFDPAGFPFASARSYTPGAASLADLESFLDRHGLDRVVLVQPSVYGTDNACVVDAIERLGQDRARGVAVVDPATADRRVLEGLRDAGIRGLRINLEAKGERRAAALGDALDRIEPSAASVGFFVEVYADLDTIRTAAPHLAELRVPVVLDHFAGARAERGLDQPGLGELKGLLATGRTWIKLSAPYRASDDPAYDDLADLARELVALRPDRMLWASDWPHTGGGKERLVRAADAIEPFRAVDDAMALGLLGDWSGNEGVRRRILVDNPAELFGF